MSHPLLKPGSTPDLSFQKLPKILWEEVVPTPLRDAELAGVSQSCAEMMGLKPDFLASGDFRRWLNGEIRLSGDQRLSSRYAGHQFGHWAGQLGDGRAISLFEYLDHEGGRWEIQTKGSGLTPFSRMGDGKAVIRSCVREYLCSEAMAGLGIPTTRALALLTGRDPVQRESVERSALVARVFPTNLRFGHFEYCAHFNEPEALKSLTAYTRENFFPTCRNDIEMLRAVVLRTARLIASWMSVGFSHGVMNTDNMSILGITIDYGPFGFMEDTDLNFVCNHSDTYGRYAFSRQPSIALWNLDRLALCFEKLIPREELIEALNLFIPAFEEAFFDLFSKKLGFFSKQEGDAGFVQETLQMLDTRKLDFTSFFRGLTDPSRWDLKDPMLKDWFGAYQKRLESETATPVDARRSKMLLLNPKYVLRNYIAQEVIEAVEAGNNQLLGQWLQILEKPFEEWPEFERYAGPTPQGRRNLAVSCSS